MLRSNSPSNNIAALSLSCAEKLQDAPVEIIIDLGTENPLAAAIHSFFVKMLMLINMYHYLGIKE